MPGHNEKQSQWQALTEEIAAAETGLRPQFGNTPVPSSETLGRIKARVRSEAMLLGPARRPHRLLKAGAMAATILLAAGLGWYFESMRSAPDDRPPAANQGIGMHASLAADSLDAFTASLSKVLSDENPAVGELNQDLQDLESEHWSNG
jgi:hypothetical protein